jgi:trans-aconitate methyltransferase
MHDAGASDILAVDLSPKMLSEIERRFGRAPTLGNSASVRTWLGDICELPDHQGRAQAIYLNAIFGNILDPHAALLKCCSLLQPEGCIVISHPLGVASSPSANEMSCLAASMPCASSTATHDLDNQCVGVRRCTASVVACHMKWLLVELSDLLNAHAETARDSFW